MKIALINENSQAAKNSMIESVLKEVVTPMGHEVVNYGMYAADDEAQLTYVQVGLLTAILLNSGAADFVITGCGTGEGAMLACNSFPGVLCGHVVDPSDAYMFSRSMLEMLLHSHLQRALAGALSLIYSTASRNCSALSQAADIHRKELFRSSAIRRSLTV